MSSSNATRTQIPETLALPSTVCFRVTRYCNIRCGFCLAPPDGAHPTAETLRERLDWLFARGVTTIHFCGGEPTIHPALVQLIDWTARAGHGVKLTTNGVLLSGALLAALRRADAEVKVSLHGDRDFHERIVGRPVFDATTTHARRLVEAGVNTSIQTTIVAGNTWVAEWVAKFCVEAGIRKLSVLPFLPRGNGIERRGEYELSSSERRELRAWVRRRRRDSRDKLDVRWLDFTARPIHVVEADGRVVLEGASESLDVLLARVPDGHPIAQARDAQRSMRDHETTLTQLFAPKSRSQSSRSYLDRSMRG